MSCPTCDHTMQGLEQRVFWCPRCGTIRVGGLDPLAVYKPMLVTRCRTFSLAIGPAVQDSFWAKACKVLSFKTDSEKDAMLAGMYELWKRLGIEEAILLPQDRSNHEKQGSTRQDAPRS